MVDASPLCIRYNALNLPDTIQFGNGRQIINSYDAGGHKLTTRYYTPIGTVIVTQGSIHGGYTTANSVLRLDDYCGSYLYENGTSASVHPLTKILTPEGYIDMSTSGYPYCYYKQDHLGSNREVTSYAGTTGTVVQQTEYYPSGTAYVEGTGAGMQPFKFTGKELINMHGLNWQDYGARYLDNVVMQWTTMDPLCEKYYAISPYTYCSDDPAKNIDPDGKDEWDVNDKGQIVKHIANKKHDAFYRVNDKGKRLNGQSLTFKYGTVKYSAYSTVVKENRGEKAVNLNMLEVKGDKNASSIYKFVAGSKQEGNSTAKTVEWGKFQVTSKHSPYNNMLGTGNDPGTEYSTPEMLQNIQASGDKIRDFTHSHPDTKGSASPYPSYADYYWFNNIRTYSPGATIHIYTPDDNQNMEY